MLDSIKLIILQSSIGRPLARKILLSWRKFRALIFGRGRVSRLAAFVIVKIYKSKGTLAQRVARSSAFRGFLSGNGKLSRILFYQFKELAWSTRNSTFLYNLATMYRLRKQYDDAFEVFFYLFKLKYNVNHCLRAMSCEIHMKDKLLYEHFKLNRRKLPASVALIMECEYSQYFDDVIVRWEVLKGEVQNNFFLPLVNKSMLAALANGNFEFIRWIEGEILKRLNDENKEYLRRTLTMLAACYYRCGSLLELRRLGDRVSYPNSDWKLYMSFGVGDLMGVMSHRGETIKNSFSIYYPDKIGSNKKRVLVPEKDLCGEAFNSLFYPAVLEQEGRFSVVCDARLFNLMRSSFPEVDFIPKTPRYLYSKMQGKFSSLPYNLSDYLDNDSYKKTSGSDFFTIDYARYFSHEVSQSLREVGWIKPNPELRAYWLERLSGYSGMKLVGFCANSTVRSRIRDMHMIGLEDWGDLFSVPNCVFINLNASLGGGECAELASKYSIEVLNPDFDLYNDFDNLLALMSVLDCGVLPANNLMDFAAAVGLTSIVFSPSRIMRSWILEGEDNYVFSRKILFVLPDELGSNKEYLVRKGASILRQLP